MGRSTMIGYQITRYSHFVSREINFHGRYPGTKKINLVAREPYVMEPNETPLELRGLNFVAMSMKGKK